MTDLKRIEAFVLVMKHGSLAEAENRSGIPKATLSRHLLRLEEELGAQLFLRTGRRPVPTQAAHTLFTHCVRLLADLNAGLDEARAVVQALSDGMRGELTVATTSHFSTSFVSQIQGKYLQRHPGMICNLYVMPEPIATFDEQIDCYICSDPPDHPNLVTRQIGRVSYRLFASPAYLIEHGLPSVPDDLAGHRGVLLQQTLKATPIVLHSNDTAHTCRFDKVAATNDYWVMKSMAVDGNGIVLLPDYFAQPEVAAGLLSPVLPAWSGAPVAVYCAYQKQRYMAKKLRAFIDLATASFAKIDALQYYIVDRGAHARAVAVNPDQAPSDVP
ncbi:MAG TPA: LysR family transcriptional regulator [Pararobbsia sp.]|nr:LysR family transcriptional regulator [Pararobbsia sp.]